MQKQRLFFLDGVRTAVVLFVVVLHAACAYSVLIPWWPVREIPHTSVFNFIIILFDLFCMPSLFFVAGFFAPHSLKRHGTIGFVKAKLKRLGVPLILLSLFLVPLITFIRHSLKASSPQSFWDNWLYQISTAWYPQFILFDSTLKAVVHADDFSQWHLWFISLLLVFFLVYALINRLVTLLLNGLTPQIVSKKTIVLQMVFASTLAITTFTIVSMSIPFWAWAKIGGYLLFQPSQLGIYLAFFLLGIMAEHSSWFYKVDIPGPLWFWLFLSLLLHAYFILMNETFTYVVGASPIKLALQHSTVRTITALTSLVTLIKMAQLWWQNPGILRRSLSKSSYHIYLLHLPILMVLQLLLFHLKVDVFIKFAVESVVVVCACWLFSHYMIMPFPRCSLALLALFFMGLSLIF